MFCLATSEENIVASIEKVYPYLKEFSSQRTSADTKLDMAGELLFETSARNNRRRAPPINSMNGAANRSKRPRYAERAQVHQQNIYNSAIYNSDEDELEGGMMADDDEDEEYE